MSILKIVSSLFKPVGSIIDNLHTSEEEKLTIKKELMNIQSELFSDMISYEQMIIKQQGSIAHAEVTGRSFLQRNWRPFTMLVFLSLIVLDCFGLLVFRLSAESWALLKIGLGGYVVGRSLEKIIPPAIAAISRK